MRANTSAQSVHIDHYIGIVECLEMVENNWVYHCGALRRLGAERGAQGAPGST